MERRAGRSPNRFVLGITSLVILLIPNIALSCKNRNLNMAEVMSDFRYIIHQDFQDLIELLDSKGYNSNYSKPQKSKHSLCSDGMEINSVHRLTCSIVYITKKINFDFTREIIALSKKTERVLKCRCKSQKRWRTRNRKSKTSNQKVPRSRTQSPPKKFLRIKKKVLDLYLCWKKLYKLTKYD